ncbi:MAG: 2-hydroxyhepta-2,4-diene,7-dioate isomerase [Firmicutes bacterium]|nr:2-hydroxyhepta-2,4-diene,7-dioate isomerase [Bacillota bacterium]
MKHVRFAMEGKIVTGFVQNGVIIDESGRQFDSEQIPVWLSPLEPNNLIALGPNSKLYVSKCEMDMPDQPILYQKYNSTLIGHKAPVYYPNGLKTMECEGQLGVIIGRTGRNICSNDALSFVRGYTIAHDISGKDFLSSYFRPPIRAKGQDTFGPIGPYLVDKEDIIDVKNLNVKTYVNGKLCTEGNTCDLLYGVSELIEYISSFMTLYPGDMIWAGTPAVPVSIKIDDIVRTEIEGLGCLENVVAADWRTKN